MKVPVESLKGKALCYALCLNEMPKLVWEKTIGVHAHSNQIVVPELPEPKCYTPFLNWDFLGPKMDEHKIELRFGDSDGDEWIAEQSFYVEDVIAEDMRGDTALEAVAKMYLLIQAGPWVSIPNDLVEETL